jgi:hypothetical protein
MSNKIKNFVVASSVPLLLFRNNAVMGFFVFGILGASAIYTFTLWLDEKVNYYNQIDMFNVSQDEIDRYAEQYPNLKIPKRESKKAMGYVLGEDKNNNGMRDHPERIMKYVFTLDQKEKNFSKVDSLLRKKAIYALKAEYRFAKNPKKYLDEYTEEARSHVDSKFMFERYRKNRNHRIGGSRRYTPKDNEKGKLSEKEDIKWQIFLRSLKHTRLNKYIHNSY